MEDYSVGRNLATICAAVVATITLIWNIVRSINERRGIIKLKYQMGFQMAANSAGAVGPTIPVIILKCTNHSRNARYLEKPRIRPSKKIDGKPELFIIQLNDTQNYPHELLPGAVLEKNYFLNDMNDYLLSKLEDGDWFRFVVYDTLGKKYETEKIKVEVIKKWIK